MIKFENSDIGETLGETIKHAEPLGKNILVTTNSGRYVVSRFSKDSQTVELLKMLEGQWFMPKFIQIGPLCIREYIEGSHMLNTPEHVDTLCRCLAELHNIEPSPDVKDRLKEKSQNTAISMLSDYEAKTNKNLSHIKEMILNHLKYSVTQLDVYSKNFIVNGDDFKMIDYEFLMLFDQRFTMGVGHYNYLGFLDVMSKYQKVEMWPNEFLELYSVYKSWINL